METDASDDAIGGTLSQKDEEGNLRPVAFYSRKLGPAEQRYEIYDKELLAIVACLLEWRVYLEGAQPPTQVITDHLNLKHFTTARSLNGRQARWAAKLGAYDFRIVYRPGRENSKADLLSRREDYVAAGRKQARKIRPPLLPESLWVGLPGEEAGDASLEKATPCGEALARGAVARAEPRVSSCHSESTAEWPRAKIQVTEATTVPTRTGNDKKTESGLTDVELQYLFCLHHDSPLAGHPGTKRILDLLQRKPEVSKLKHLHAKVENYVRNCVLWARAKPSQKKTHGTLLPLPTPEGTWQDISMDCIVALPESTDPGDPGGPTYNSI